MNRNSTGSSHRGLLLRIVIPAGTAILLFTLVFVLALLPSFRSNLLGQKRLALRSLTESSYQILASYHQRELAGEMPRQQAQTEAARLINQLRYGPEAKDYFWINDLHHRMIMHPYRPDLEGLDLANFRDPDGTLLFQRFVECVAAEGEGYVEYLWQRHDDPDQIVPKLSFVKGFQPWGWILGTGMYLDDVETSISAIQNKVILTSLGILSVILLLVSYSIWRELQLVRERERNKAALASAHRKLESVLDSATLVAIIATDRDGRITLFSRGAERMLGYRAGEMVGHKTPLHYHLEAELKTRERELSAELGRPIDGFEALACKALLAGQEEQEFTYVKRDGSQITVTTATSAVRDQAGEVVGLLSVALDITPRKTVEKALRDSEQRQQLHFANTPLAVIEWDPDFKVTKWNPAAEKIFGYPASEAMGRHAASLIIPASARQHMNSIWQQLKAQRGGTRSVNENRTADDRQIVCEWYNTPLVNDNDTVIGVASLVADITESLRAKEETEELKLSLQHAQKMEAIGTLAGGIAHDFNNILFSAIGFTDLALKETPPASRTFTCLEEAQIAHRRAAELVKQILTFSRKSEQRRKAVRLQPLIKEALKLLRGTLPSTIEIEQNIDSDCGPVLVNPIQIHQVLMNLATNAAQAMPDRRGRLQVTYTIAPDQPADPGRKTFPLAGPYALLTVADDGEGMDRETCKRIFEPYFTTKQVSDGSGMGLATVHGIVVDHGGKIEVTSDIGMGSRFHIYPPLFANTFKNQDQETPPAETVPEVDVAQAATPTPPETPSGRILYVDDETQLVDLAAIFLGEAGFQVDVFTDSRAACHQFASDPTRYDLVITDQTMPNLTGAELAQQVLEQRPDLPVILCTGYSDTLTQEQAAEIGIKEYLLKPIFPEELLNTIHQVLRNNERKEESCRVS
ncbi:MAG: PAS domain S-box protein [bacterium]